MSNLFFKKKSFTLIELLLVVLLLSLLTGLSMPKFSKTNEFISHQQFGEILKQKIIYTHDLSILLAKDIHLTYDEDSTQIKAINPSKNHHISEKKLNPKGHLNIPDDVDIYFEPETIKFYSTGRITPFEIEIQMNRNTLICRKEDYISDIELVVDD